MLGIVLHQITRCNSEDNESRLKRRSVQHHAQLCTVLASYTLARLFPLTNTLFFWKKKKRKEQLHFFAIRAVTLLYSLFKIISRLLQYSGQHFSLFSGKLINH